MSDKKPCVVCNGAGTLRNDEKCETTTCMACGGKGTVGAEAKKLAPVWWRR